MTPRVLILTPYFFPLIGGVESNAERFAEYLRGIGIDVRVLTKRLSPTLPDSDERHGVPVTRIGQHGDRAAMAKWLMVPAVFGWLVRRRSSYDVVCVIDYRGVGVAAVLARAITGRRVMIQGQTTGILSGQIAGTASPREGLLTRVLKWPARQIYVRADAIACISRVLESEALAYGVPRSRVHHLPNGIDMTRFTPAAAGERQARRLALGLDDDAVACVFVGRLSQEKGVVELVEAWNLARPAGAVLLIAGPDMHGSPWNAGPAARAIVDRQRLGDSVRFLGPASDVPGLLQLADIAIQPSHFEALGLSAIEALACGLPVIASRVGGLPEFVTDGVNGRLVPVRDVASLAAAIIELVVDASTRRRLAAAARSSVTDYDTRVVFTRMIHELTKLAMTRT